MAVTVCHHVHCIRFDVVVVEWESNRILFHNHHLFDTFYDVGSWKPPLLYPLFGRQTDAEEEDDMDGCGDFITLKRDLCRSLGRIKKESWWWLFSLILSWRDCKKICFGGTTSKLPPSTAMWIKSSCSHHHTNYRFKSNRCSIIRSGSEGIIQFWRRIAPVWPVSVS